MWIPERTNQFKKQFKNLNSQLQTKVGEVIILLCNSNDPKTLGIYKKHMDVYAYEIGSSYRIIYDVKIIEKTIVFIRVGDHKQVYGKD